MRHQHFFFATRADLIPGFEYIESQWELEYHLCDMRPDRDFCFLFSLLAQDTLGMSRMGDAGKDDEYLVYPRDRRPSIRSIPQRKGGTRYVLEPSPETVHFRPGGLHRESSALVAGRIARGVHANARGDSLYRSLSSALLRGFNKVQMFWLGPDAYAGFKGGQRLVTMSIRSPREYDLAGGASGVVQQGDEADKA